MQSGDCLPFSSFSVFVLERLSAFSDYGASRPPQPAVPNQRADGSSALRATADPRHRGSPLFPKRGHDAFEREWSKALELLRPL